ncbi:MAG: TerB family tellurite resistance protein [Rhodobacteraceae bacterium]|nr:TerB family tellurite resistance protein [Paracoccaceae bacterium]
MFSRITALLAGSAEPPDTRRRDDLEMSVAALLVEAARMDDAFDPAERTMIEELLMQRFELTTPEVRHLLTQAEDASNQSVELFGFIRGMVKKLDYDDRVHLIEMLWDVAYADGELSPEEDMLIRRIAGLIFVEDKDRGAARRRVLDRISRNT